MSIKDVFKKPELPRLELDYTMGDKMLDVASGMILIAFWVYIWTMYNQLPGEIPTHYNLAGEVDATGSKVSILMLPGIATVTAILLTVMNRFPHKMNYAVKITPENAPRQYRNATTMLRVIRLTIVVIFFIIAYFIIHYEGKNQGGEWLLPLVAGMALLPTVIFIGRSLRMR